MSLYVGTNFLENNLSIGSKIFILFAETVLKKSEKVYM